MGTPEIIIRGKVTYAIYEDRVIVGVNNQWTSYNPYENFNRAGITEFKDKIQKSKETEYGLAADFMSLASECGIRGISTRPPKDI